MKILRGHAQKLTVIDHKKLPGELGQYREDTHAGEGSRRAAVDLARSTGCEIRWDLAQFGTIISALRFVTVVYRAELPPAVIQSFHTHDVYELVLITHGTLIAVESETLTDKDALGIFEQGLLVLEGDLLIHEPGVRHTLANRYSEGHSAFIVIQTPHPPYGD